MSTVRTVNQSVGRLAREHPGLEKVGRFGWAAKGVVYAIAGVLALLIAVRAAGWSNDPSTGTEEASPTGALKTVAHGAGGPVLLALLGVGMLTYAAWRVISAFLPSDGSAKAWVKRIGYLVSAVLYGFLAVTAFSIMRSKAAESKNGNTSVSQASGGLMAHTGGRLLIGVVGVIVIVAGLYRLVKGFKLDVDDELDLSGVSPARRRWSERIGAVGEVGRGVGIGLIGFFLLRAAITYDPNKATGLDGALRTLATNTAGLILVVVVGIGFLAYGVFCLTTFTHRRLQGP